MSLEHPPATRPVSAFASMAGRQPNLVGYYSGWAEPFNRSFAELVHRHGVTPYIQIDPTLGTVSAIAAGTYDDSYLRPYADSVRDFGHPVVIGFGHEMNATWYSWGYKHVRAQTFVAAWRHIVTVFNSEGAKNVTWLWTINQDLPGTGPIASWWPGPKLRHLGRHRRILLQVIRHLQQRLREHHPDRSASSPRSRFSCPRLPYRPKATHSVRQDRRPVYRDAEGQDARPGLVRQRPAERRLSVIRTGVIEDNFPAETAFRFVGGSRTLTQRLSTGRLTHPSAAAARPGWAPGP